MDCFNLAFLRFTVHLAVIRSQLPGIFKMPGSCVVPTLGVVLRPLQVLEQGLGEGMV
jgi:hypothetical protein